MRKDEAISLLGGSISAAADAVGVSYQAVRKWPEELPTRIADRVWAALARRGLPTSLDADKQGICPLEEQAAIDLLKSRGYTILRATPL